MKKMLLAFLWLIASSANAIELDLPLRCSPGKDCFIQNYVDTQVGEKHRDYRCNFLSYNNHTGTDFRLPSYVDMNRGVDVIAAADGIVKATREGMADVNVKTIGVASLKNQECGNAVIVTHADGWQTDYCHLKKGSIKVKSGDKVRTGQTLGQVGLSGNTEFPHVHFAVRKKGKILDPFTSRPTDISCESDTPVVPLWNQKTQAKLAYQLTALLAAGFTEKPPEPEDARAGKHTDPELGFDAPAIIFWVDMMGIQKDDVLKMHIIGPDKKILAEKEQTFKKNAAVQFMYIGKTNKNVGLWKIGNYLGKAELTRIDSRGKTTTVFTKEVPLTIF